MNRKEIHNAFVCITFTLLNKVENDLYLDKSWQKIISCATQRKLSERCVRLHKDFFVAAPLHYWLALLSHVYFLFITHGKNNFFEQVLSKSMQKVKLSIYVMVNFRSISTLKKIK